MQILLIQNILLLQGHTYRTNKYAMTDLSKTYDCFL